METLSVQYQRERSGLESDNLIILVIQALCYWAISAISAIGAISLDSLDSPDSEGAALIREWVLTTEQIAAFARAIAKTKDGEPDHVTNRRVGRVLGRMRLEKVPRPGGKGSRRWRVTLGDLERWTAAYGMPLSAPLAAFFAANDPNSGVTSAA